MGYDLGNSKIELLNNGAPITEHTFFGSPDRAWCCASYFNGGPFNGTFSIFSGADSGDL